MAKARTILDELRESSLLVSALHGVRTMLERELGLRDILIESDEMIKRRIQNRVRQNEEPQYPYSFLTLNELQAVKDLQPNKTVRRLGYRMGTIEPTRTTATKGFIFPVRVSLDLKYLNTKPDEAILVAEAMMVLGQAGSLNFELVVGNPNDLTGSESMRLESRLEIPESVSIPVSDSNNASMPGAIEVTFSIILHTYSGFFRDVSAVQAAKPIITTTLV